MNGKTFLAFSNQHKGKTSDQSLGKAQPPLFDDFSGERIVLDKPKPQKSIDLHEAILNRRSYRKFLPTPLSLDVLSYALWATQGVKKIVEGRATFRTVPSAGARHAFETYVLINHSQDLDLGLYRYDANEHALVFIKPYEEVKDKILAGCLNQRMVVDAAVCFFWVASFYRMTYRYEERGYRYLLLDAGHISQNLYLVAETLNAKTCAIGAFDDDLLNQALGVDGENHSVLYAAPLGNVNEH